VGVTKNTRKMKNFHASRWLFVQIYHIGVDFRIFFDAGYFSGPVSIIRVFHYWTKSRLMVELCLLFSKN